MPCTNRDVMASWTLISAVCCFLILKNKNKYENVMEYKYFSYFCHKIAYVDSEFTTVESRATRPFTPYFYDVGAFLVQVWRVIVFFCRELQYTLKMRCLLYLLVVPIGNLCVWIPIFVQFQIEIWIWLE